MPLWISLWIMTGPGTIKKPSKINILNTIGCPAFLLYCKQTTYSVGFPKISGAQAAWIDCYVGVEYAQVWGGMFSKRY
jgi:hypothetical protein